MVNLNPFIKFETLLKKYNSADFHLEQVHFFKKQMFKTGDDPGRGNILLSQVQNVTLANYKQLMMSKAAW